MNQPISEIIDFKSLTTISKMKAFLKSIDSVYSFSKKEEYEKRIDAYKSICLFPWRDEQQSVLDAFQEFKHSTYVIHAIFGSGKTTLLIGMLVYGILLGHYKPSQVMFMSFNISIRNEIKRRLKDFGISSKVCVRTFDSLIYELCKMFQYEYIDQPNYDGKRKYIHQKCYENDCLQLSFQPSVIFIDECQDLEYQTLVILKHFYPNSKFIFAGDIFQSIQKEPRESILWHYMTLPPREDIFKIYMAVTPRVPQRILGSLQNALSKHYPEFKDRIDTWTSSNQNSDFDIEWRRLYSYTNIFEEMKHFCEEYKAQETMFLTFSSSITVRGNIGDISRLRRWMCSNNLDVNLNHKRMDPDQYFLSTANSSKGLERDYVVVFLTFPLEKAFMQLSDDVVVNLITVALTRAKKRVFIYVPAYEDKFSKCLKLFQECPSPNKAKIRDDHKPITEFKYSDYMNNEHCVTEILRMNILKYDTRIELKKSVKCYNQEKWIDGNTPPIPKLITEEEQAFVGIIVENLITSCWKREWPSIGLVDIPDIRTNPMYHHCSGIYNRCLNEYKKIIFTQSYSSSSDVFENIYLYSQLVNIVSNKLSMALSPTNFSILKSWWNNMKNRAYEMRPTGTKIDVQSRINMPWLTGIADVIVSNTNAQGYDELEVYEIKSSTDYEWKDFALSQAICYALAMGKSWSRIILLNPFRNEKVSYYFDSKNIITLRQLIIRDVLTSNLNSVISKSFSQASEQSKDLTKYLFLDAVVSHTEGTKFPDKIVSLCITKFQTALKTEVIYNKYTNSQDCVPKERKRMTKEEKFQHESKNSSDDILKEVKEILNHPINKDKIIVLSNNNLIKYTELFDSKKIMILDNESIADFQMIIDMLNYEPQLKKKYALNDSDSLYRCVLLVSFTFYYGFDFFKYI